jgi:hypothetical protein
MDLGLSIYGAPRRPGHPLHLDDAELERRLADALTGAAVGTGRPRDDTVRALVCSALGHPVPETWHETVPHFPAPGFNLCVRDAVDTEIWGIGSKHRCVVVDVDGRGTVSGVRILTVGQLSASAHWHSALCV